MTDNTLHHRKTDALSPDDLLRVEWAYKRYVKGRNMLRLNSAPITIQFSDPPELQPDEWAYPDTVPSVDTIKYKSAKFNAECLGYYHEGGAWEWVNIIAEFKGVRICIDHWRFENRHVQHRETNQF